jgi:hypothetical protein
MAKNDNGHREPLPETVNPASITAGTTTHLPTKPLTPEQAAECDRLNVALLASKKALLEAQRAWFKDPRNPFAGEPGYDPDNPYINEAYRRYVDMKSATTSPKQHQANGSTGPRTPEGKAKSARNAFRHGFASAQVILDASEVDAYNAHLDAYAATFQPVNQPEADAVRRMADAQWRMDVFKTAESTLVELETQYQCLMLIDHDKIAKLAGPWELRHYRTLTFIDITQERAWDLLHRYHADAAREYSRAFAIFRKLTEMREQLGPPTLPPSDRVEVDDQPEPGELLPDQLVRNELPAAAAAADPPRKQPEKKSRRLNLGRIVSGGSRRRR